MPSRSITASTTSSSGDLGASWERVGIAPWGDRTGQQCISPDGACIYCIGGEGNPSCNGGRNTLFHDVWKSCDGARNWARVANNAFGCDPATPCGGGYDPALNCGKDDFVTRVKDGKIWMIAGDEETQFPFPMSNSVWTLEDDGADQAPPPSQVCADAMTKACPGLRGDVDACEACLHQRHGDLSPLCNGTGTGAWYCTNNGYPTIRSL